MAKSQASFMKKQLDNQRKKKKQEKADRKQDRKQNSTGGGLENMMAYVNEFGEISSTPPEKPAKKDNDQ
jgi:Skp family chaperone for outer membrane proteins